MTCNLIVVACKPQPSSIIFLNLLTGQIKCKEQFEMIRSLDENDVINIAIGDAIKAVWTDPGKSFSLIYRIVECNFESWSRA